jgi:hypothetical protein
MGFNSGLKGLNVATIDSGNFGTVLRGETINVYPANVEKTVSA